LSKILKKEKKNRAFIFNITEVICTRGTSSEHSFFIMQKVK